MMSAVKSPQGLFVAAIIALGVLFALTGALRIGAPAQESLAGFMARESKLYSQFDEELLIRYFFQDETGGFYLDVGCAFPSQNSTTYYMELRRGWTGIGIDAVKEYGDQWRQIRPRSKFFHYAVSDSSGDTVTFYQAKHPGLSSFDKDWGDQFGMPEPTPVEVETITLNDLLDREGVKKIDLMSIDIEGAEPLALKGFDIERFAPQLVCIEVHEGAESEPFISKYFAEHGYERIDAYMEYDYANWYFTPKQTR
jgi:FkbM family methyltransferase